MTTKRRFIKHLPLMLAGLALGLGVFINVFNSNNKVEETSAATDISTYYNNITATGGTSLLGQLHDLSVEKHTNYNSYSGDISTTNCAKTDPYQNTSYIIDFYSGAPTKNQITSSGTVGWNREHVWCQNLSNSLYGTTGAGADIQHIRPTIPKINSDRGDKKYGELNNSGTASTATDANGNTVYGGYYSGSTFQPMDNKKGDAARIVMYLYMHYNKATNVGGTKDGTNSSYFGTLNFTHVMAANSEAAAIQLLLTWNTADPVDTIETTRNDEAAKITGCRNPFIDHPEYANLIWGGSSNPSASISPSSPSVIVGNTVSLTATLSNVSNANQISWESSSPSNATVVKGTTSTTSSVATVTGVAAGSATIRCKYNNAIIGSVTVTVTSSGSQSGGEYSILHTDLATAYPTDATSYTAASGISFTAYNTANFGSKVQFKKSGGYLYNNNSLNLGTLTLNELSGTITVYGGSSSNPSSTTISGTDGLYNLSGYKYFKIINSSSAVATCNSITIGVTSSSQGEVTSINASVNRIFYVGESISSSDITVKDNNNSIVSTFNFANNGYKFMYSDAASGGASTSKTFTNAISASNFTCSLTVQVQRKAYSTPSTVLLSHTGSEFSTAGIGDSFTTNQTATVDGITFSVDGYIYNNKLSLSSSKTSVTGKVINTTPYSNGITNVTFTGASPDVQLSTDGSSWVDLSETTPTKVNYYYLKIFYKTTTQSNYVNITQIDVTLKGAETISNVANYIMFEDTNNQCATKLNIALVYFQNLSISNRNSFASSNDYVVSTARTRLDAWARNQGKTINYSTGTLSNASRLVPIGNNESNSSIIMLVVLSLVAIVAIGGYIYIYTKRY